MYIKNKRGQSTVEYVLLVTAVVAVVIAFLAKPGSVFQNQLNTTLNTVTGDITTGAGVLSASHQPDSSNSTTNATPPPYTINPGQGAP